MRKNMLYIAPRDGEEGFYVACVDENVARNMLFLLQEAGIDCEVDYPLGNWASFTLAEWLMNVELYPVVHE